MSQAAVLNYVLGCIDVYTIPDHITDVESWLIEKGLMNEGDCEWMATDGIIPITIHA